MCHFLPSLPKMPWKSFPRTSLIYFTLPLNNVDYLDSTIFWNTKKYQQFIWGGGRAVYFVVM